MQPNRSMSDSQVIPELAYPDVVSASSWLCTAFGFSERLRIANHRIQLRYGAGAVILVTGPDAREPAVQTGHSVLVRVDNVDEHFAQAQRAGARVAGPPATYPYGERQYSALDLAGHRWTFSQTIADMHPSDWGGLLVQGENGA